MTVHREQSASHRIELSQDRGGHQDAPPFLRRRDQRRIDELETRGLGEEVAHHLRLSTAFSEGALQQIRGAQSDVVLRWELEMDQARLQMEHITVPSPEAVQ